MESLSDVLVRSQICVRRPHDAEVRHILHDYQLGYLLAPTHTEKKIGIAIEETVDSAHKFVMCHDWSMIARCLGLAAAFPVQELTTSELLAHLVQHSSLIDLPNSAESQIADVDRLIEIASHCQTYYDSNKQKLTGDSYCNRMSREALFEFLLLLRRSYGERAVPQIDVKTSFIRDYRWVFVATLASCAAIVVCATLIASLWKMSFLGFFLGLGLAYLALNVAQSAFDTRTSNWVSRVYSVEISNCPTLKQLLDFVTTKYLAFN